MNEDALLSISDAIDRLTGSGLAYVQLANYASRGYVCRAWRIELPYSYGDAPQWLVFITVTMNGVPSQQFIPCKNIEETLLEAAKWLTEVQSAQWLAEAKADSDPCLF